MLSSEGLFRKYLISFYAPEPVCRHPRTNSVTIDNGVVILGRELRCTDCGATLRRWKVDFDTLAWVEAAP